MLKSIIKVSAPIILIIIILIIGFNTYQDTLENTDNPLSIIPSNSSIILQFNDAKNLSVLLKSTVIWEKLLSINQMQLIDDNINEISTFFSKHHQVFASNSLFVSFHKVGANNSGVLFSSNFSIENISSQREITSLFGTILKIFLTGKFEFLFLLLYLVMGWLIVIEFNNILLYIDLYGIYLLVLGGVCYTIGVVFYSLDNLKYSHTIWHLFVLGGSISHYFMILFYII